MFIAGLLGKTCQHVKQRCTAKRTSASQCSLFWPLQKVFPETLLQSLSLPTGRVSLKAMLYLARTLTIRAVLLWGLSVPCLSMSVCTIPVPEVRETILDFFYEFPPLE